MINTLAAIFPSDGFTPHGHCFLWTPPLLWTYVLSDSVIAASYYSIPFALWYIVHRRRDLPFPGMFLMLGTFVLACGTTHIFEVWNIWHADYWADAGIKVLTAFVSAATAILLWFLMPRILSFPSRAQLEGANRELLNEVMRRERAESELRMAHSALEHRVFERTRALENANKSLSESEARFRGLVEQSIAGTYIVQDGKFVYINPYFAEIFGYKSAEDLIGRDAFLVVAEKDRSTVAANARRRFEGRVGTLSYEFAGLRADGSMIQIGGRDTRAIHDGHPAVIGQLLDISERRRAEAEIKNYIKQLKAAFMSTVEMATTLSEMHDPYTTGHERAVADIAVAIGKELGLDERQNEVLRLAGNLHDIGKMSIPSEILAKPGKLNSIERMFVEGHAQASFDVLKSVSFPGPVAQIVLQHHERMDGTGYPQGLKGEAILLEARILAVADVVDAMCSHRPYRPGLGIEKALSEIESGSGSAYDVHVANACVRLFREGRYVSST